MINQETLKQYKDKVRDMHILELEELAAEALYHLQVLVANSAIMSVYPNAENFNKLNEVRQEASEFFIQHQV